MANETMTLISTVTVGALGASSIDYTSISGSFTDLMLVLSARSTGASWQGSGLKFNGSTSSIYTFRRLEGSGSGTSSDSNTLDFLPIGSIPGLTQTSNTFSNQVIYIPNYAGATNKSVSVDTVAENNATQAYQQLIAGVYASTTAITSIKLEASFAQYSTASLYGIKSGSGGATVS